MRWKICKNQQDFEHFLDTLSRPMRVEANFGIIDAYGGAAYYETNNTRYYKKDVNDPNLAPDGILSIRISPLKAEKMKGTDISVMKVPKRFSPISIRKD